MVRRRRRRVSSRRNPRVRWEPLVGRRRRRVSNGRNPRVQVRALGLEED